MQVVNKKEDLGGLFWWANKKRKTIWIGFCTSQGGPFGPGSMPPIFPAWPRIVFMMVRGPKWLPGHGGQWLVSSPPGQNGSSSQAGQSLQGSWDQQSQLRWQPSQEGKVTKQRLQIRGHSRERWMPGADELIISGATSSQLHPSTLTWESWVFKSRITGFYIKSLSFYIWKLINILTYLTGPNKTYRCWNLVCGPPSWNLYLSNQLLPSGKWEIWTSLFLERGELSNHLPPGFFPPTAFLSTTLATGTNRIFSSVSLSPY